MTVNTGYSSVGDQTSAPRSVIVSTNSNQELSTERVLSAKNPDQVNRYTTGPSFSLELLSSDSRKHFDYCELNW